MIALIWDLFLSECVLRSVKWREFHRTLHDASKINIANIEESQANFHKLQELFQFYLQVQAYAGHQSFSYTRSQGGHQDLDNILGAHRCQVSSLLRNSPILEFFRDRLNQYVAKTATHAINKLPPIFLDSIPDHVLVLQNPGSSTIASIRKALQGLRDLDRKVRTEKHRQLQQLSDLVEAHPLQLKRPLDPSQTPTEAKTAHLLAQFLSYTKNVPRGYAAKYLFHSLSLPVVPYDRCVRLFVEALETKEVASVISASTRYDSADVQWNSGPKTCGGDHSITANGSWQNVKLKSTNSLSEDLNTAVAGLFELYDTGDGLGNPRIWWDLRDGRGGFSSEKRPRVITDYYYEPYEDLRDRGPVYQRELNWLKAFLRVVSWIEECYPALAHQVYSNNQVEDGRGEN